jgi:hypothetical protein
VKCSQETKVVVFQNYLPRSALGNTNSLRTYKASPASQTESFFKWKSNLDRKSDDISGISWSTSDRFPNKTRAQPYTWFILDVIEVFGMSEIFIEVVNLTCLIPKEDLQKVTESCSQESKLG